MGTWSTNRGGLAQKKYCKICFGPWSWLIGVGSPILLLGNLLTLKTKWTQNWLSRSPKRPTESPRSLKNCNNLARFWDLRSGVISSSQRFATSTADSKGLFVARGTQGTHGAADLRYEGREEAHGQEDDHWRLENAKSILTKNNRVVKQNSYVDNSIYI